VNGNGLFASWKGNTTMKDIINEILESKTFDDMEFTIANFLDNREDNKAIRGVIELYATIKCKEEGWKEKYRIPNVNGMKRPLMKWEIEEIMLEDRGYKQRSIL
jgi:hypothetical protein